MSRKEPTISSILQELADSFDSVVAERDVFDRVLARRPSSAKNPYANMRQQLRFGAPRLGWVWLGGGKLMPLRVALQDLRFRVIPADEELAAGLVTRGSMRPFVPYGDQQIRFEDARGRLLLARETALPLGEGLFGPVTASAIDLADWFERERFAPGDSILLTIAQFAPLTLRIEREAAETFQPDRVAEQDRQLVDQLVERFGRSHQTMVSCEDSVLPIYATAPWRSAYPGRPWQELVVNDRRLRLLDGDFIADAKFRRPLDMLFGDERDDQFWQEADAELLDAISKFQSELLARRREAVDRGLWDGIAPRVSTSRTVFDFEEGTATTVYPGAVDALEDHTADIEEHVARGDYEDEDWEADSEADFDDMDSIDGLEFDEEVADLDEIEDVRMLLDQNPALGEATRRIMDSLSPDEVRQLEDAESFDDVERVLGSKLNDLLRSDPSLFVPIEMPTLESLNKNGNGHANGNGHHPDGDADLLSDEGWVDDDLPDDEWSEDDADDLEVSGAGQAEVAAALERSSALMEQFVSFQTERGKSSATATNRAQDLWLYADFLGNFYARALDQGDYATLDECLFFFYPRKVINSSPRAARELCTSIKQFYGFLKSEGKIDDDAFAVAIWQRREQAARVVELYDQIDSESPQFTRLFARLFAPYTA